MLLWSYCAGRGEVSAKLLVLKPSQHRGWINSRSIDATLGASPYRKLEGIRLARHVL